MSDEWTEVNLVLAAQGDRLPVLLNVVDPLIHGDLSQHVDSWHYGYYEDKPPSPHIRVRILWHSTSQVTAAKSELSRSLDAKKPNVIVDWYEGSHGTRNEIYHGEAEEFGAEMWEPTYKLWESQSEFALQLLKNEDASSLSMHPFVWHWERSMHLLTNRLFLNPLDEVYLTLRQASGYLGTIGSRSPDAKFSTWTITLGKFVEFVQQQVVNEARPILNEIVSKDFDDRFKPNP